MQRVFIIHGWDGSPDGWIAWLKAQLEKNDIEAFAPQMPNAAEPKMEEWVPYLAELVGTPDENTYFVGHSIGCQTIMRYLEKISPQKVGKIIFVAGWFHLVNLEDAESEAVAKPWIATPIDLKKVKASAGNTTVYLSDNDGWVPLSDKEIFEQRLGAKVIVKKDKGHFTADDGVFEFPELMAEILK